MAKFELIRNEYIKRYSNSAGDADIARMLGLFAMAADKLSPAAQLEFVKIFDFEYALDGELFLGSSRLAPSKYPNLMREAGVAGIKIVLR